MKKKLYREPVKILGENPKVKKEDVFVIIVTVGREDWSFGNGIAQLTELTGHNLSALEKN